MLLNGREEIFGFIVLSVSAKNSGKKNNGKTLGHCRKPRPFTGKEQAKTFYGFVLPDQIWTENKVQHKIFITRRQKAAVILHRAAAKRRLGYRGGISSGKKEYDAG